MTFCLRLLGSPTLEHAGELRSMALERRNQLLVYLALKQSWVTRAELASLLWPELETRLAYTNLRKILFRLQALAWSDRIETQAGALRFQVATDVIHFETALREQRLADALALRRGELLAGFDDDANEAWTSWLGFERDRLRVAWRDAALERLGSDLDPAEGIELSARLLESDPLDEAALRAHMASLERSGQGGRARRVYRDFVVRLEGELGLAPGAELVALHDSIGTVPAAVPTAHVAAKASRPVDDGFVGRQVELRRIASRMAQEDCRLLCLIGPGGIGKTRLAQRALQDLGASFADGAAFVPLEDVTDAPGLTSRLARAIGVQPAGNRELLEQVVEALRPRQMLLALDNFEQLAAAAPVLQGLLEACPQVKLLVTSRVRLGIPLEWLLPVEGLPAPEMEDADRIEAFDAVRLFVNAAHRVEPALIASSEAAGIIEICALVEGLPLALELAAAWTRVLSCQSIAAELRLGTELLRADDAGHPARHASVDVVFDHSWQLLSPAEREALARLSVFRGGFSAEAARAVAAASLPVLGALADKSLLRKEDDRIHLHPLVQQLASARLADDARAAAEAAHAAYFHRMLRQLREPAEKGDRDALRQLEREFENCRGAWRWAVRHGGVDLLRRSAEALVQFCDYHGWLDAGLGLMQEAMDSEAVKAHASLQALLLAESAHLRYRLNRYAEAQADAGRALERAGTKGEVGTRLTCLKVLGGCSLRLGRHDDARRHYEQALELGPAHTNPRNAATMTDHLALVAKWTGDHDTALRLSLDALAQHRSIGDVGAEALCLNNLGALYIDRREYDAARVHVREALAICDRHGIASTRAYLVANLAEIGVWTHDNAAAEVYAAQALELAEATANRAIACWMRIQLSLLAVRRNDLATARTQLASALGIGTAIRMPSLLLSGVLGLGEILHAQGEAECARRILAFAAAQPAMQPRLRESVRERLAEWRPAGSEPPPWPALGLDELLHRAVAEAPLAHAPLVGLIRGAA